MSDEFEVATDVKMDIHERLTLECAAFSKLCNSEFGEPHRERLFGDPSSVESSRCRACPNTSRALDVVEVTSHCIA